MAKMQNHVNEHPNKVGGIVGTGCFFSEIVVRASPREEVDGPFENDQEHLAKH